MRKSRIALSVAVLGLLGSALFLLRPIGTGDTAHSARIPGKPVVRPAVPHFTSATPEPIVTSSAPRIQIFDRPGQEPSWALRYGGEFWRTGTQTAGSINFGAVVDRVKHSFAADQRPLDVTGSTFAVQLDGRGFRFSPFLPGDGKPAAQPGVSLRMETGSIREG